jgi:regulator of protease activity HflC (stomatin/prohibitin superfamily)
MTHTPNSAERHVWKGIGAGLYLVILLSTFLVIFGGTGMIFYTDTEMSVFGATSPVNWGRLIWILAGIYLLASIRIVPESKVAAIIFIGIPLVHLGSGPTIVPLLLSKLAIFPGTNQQDELPADPENIFRNEDVAEVPKGKFPPNRITFNKKDGSSDPLDRRITAEVPLIVTWHIDNAVKFVQAIGDDPVGALVEARRQMNDTGIAAATKYFGNKMTTAEAIGRLAEASDEVKHAIDHATLSWGINIPRAEIKALGLNHSLNKAMADVPEAEFKAQAKTAEGQGVKNFAEKSGISPQDTIAVEVAKAFAGGANTTVIAGADGFSQIMGLAAGIKQGLAEKGTTKKSGNDS